LKDAAPIKWLKADPAYAFRYRKVAAVAGSELVERQTAATGSQEPFH
jgi:hypothetical protein